MINKQSNAYTIIYITVMVVIVGAALAFTAMSLKDRQLENADADKMKQILQSVHITTERSTVVEDFQKYITSAFVINDRGETVDGQDAFTVNVAAEAKKPYGERPRSPRPSVCSRYMCARSPMPAPNTSCL